MYELVNDEPDGIAEHCYADVINNAFFWGKREII